MLLFCRDSSHRQADALGGSPLTTIKIAIAATAFVEYRQHHTPITDGANWCGDVMITIAEFRVIRRLLFSHRQLHLMLPVTGGVRCKYEGSTTCHGFRKGD
jgi:hypothetical protein